MNEKEYIERNELIKNLNYFAPEHYSALINDLIMKQPSADAAPVRHGKWCGKVCSSCGESTSFYYDCDYCPNCGAKMDGD